MRIPELTELTIKNLGPTSIPSNIARSGRFVDESSRVLMLSDSVQVESWLASGRPLPTLERAGPRAQLFFQPDQTVCGIVTCGGLCPGLNDVIRSLALNLLVVYGVHQVLGFRYGYKGLSRQGPEPVVLDIDRVQRLAGTAGSFLGSSRGPQEVSEMVDTLQRRGVSVLFVIGGDGTLRGASALAAEVARRGASISIIGLPKTIDNDIAWTNVSFGFHTAVEEARKVVLAAYAEASSAENGIGLVKLMGRHSGFIAAHASRASGVANFCIIPEEPLQLDNLLSRIKQRLHSHGQAVIVVAEGAGQELMACQEQKDASGNLRLQDIGLLLKERVSQHLTSQGVEFTLKYFDPSYSIRSAPANTIDSEYCLLLGHFAAHAGLAGKTDMTLGMWHQRFVHLPIAVVTESRKRVDLEDELWQTVLTMTAQPRTD